MASGGAGIGLMIGLMTGLGVLCSIGGIAVGLDASVHDATGKVALTLALAVFGAGLLIAGAILDAGSRKDPDP